MASDATKKLLDLIIAAIDPNKGGFDADAIREARQAIDDESCCLTADALEQLAEAAESDPWASPDPNVTFEPMPAVDVLGHQVQSGIGGEPEVGGADESGDEGDGGE